MTLREERAGNLKTWAWLEEATEGSVPQVLLLELKVKGQRATFGRVSPCSYSPVALDNAPTQLVNMRCISLLWLDGLASCNYQAGSRGQGSQLANFSPVDKPQLSTGSGLFVRKMLASGIAAGADLILKILVSVGSRYVHGPAHGPEPNIWLNMFVF